MARRKKQAETEQAQNIPGADTPPPAVETPQALSATSATAQTPEAPAAQPVREEAETPDQFQSPQPWANFNEPPKDPAHDSEAIRQSMQKQAETEQALVNAPGFHWHEARRDSGSGKYRKGKRYLLPDGQAKALFKKLGK